MNNDSVNDSSFLTSPPVSIETDKNLVDNSSGTNGGFGRMLNITERGEGVIICARG